MGVLNQLTTDLYINGAFSCKSLTPPAASIPNSAIPAAAGISASKLQQQLAKDYGQPNGTTPVTERKVIHVVYGATCTILSLKVGTKTVLTGLATITVDILKNGTSILTGVVTINNTQTAYQLVSGALATTPGVQGDVYEINVVATAGGGGLGGGIFASLVLNEDAQ